MDRNDWRGVFAAITTPLRADYTVDHEALGRHVSWLIDSGCRGIVPNGSLGESATLAFSEKVEVLRTCCRAAAGRAPVVAGIAGLATGECVQLAREAEQDVALLAPVIRAVARGVLDHPHAHRPELTCAPARLARITRVSRRFDGAPVGRTEGNVLHLHGRAGYRVED